LIQLTQDGQDILFSLKVVPKSSRDRIVGELDGALKVTVSAAPERGAANAAVCKLLAKAIGVRPQQVVIELGHGSPRKTVRIRGLTLPAIRAALNV